jgi:hypothetical protein
VAIAAWKAYPSPLRHGRPLGSCATGGHRLWWAVEATVEFEQEMVEILAMDGDTVLGEAATAIRIPGLAPCLGPLQSP